MMRNDGPHSEPPELPWYYPRSLAWLLVEILHLIRVYFHEKRTSWKARRWAMEMQIAQGMQSAFFIAKNKDARRNDRRNALRTMRQYKELAEELGIDDHHIIRRYIEEFENLSEGHNV